MDEHLGNADRGTAAIKRPKKAPLYRRVPPRGSLRLEDRDLDVLEALAVHRFLSGEQLGRLCFRCGASMVRRRLRALYDAGLIERRVVIARPTQGVPPFVYFTTKEGVAALAEEGRAPRGTPRVGWDLRTFRHRFLVNDFFVTLSEVLRAGPYSLRSWKHEEQLKLPTADGWGRVEQVTHPSLARTTPFLPDAYFELARAGGPISAYFLEADRATHGLRIWATRAKLYMAYATAGLFRQRFGHDAFKLLIVTTPDHRGRSRRDNILATIRQSIGPSPLFLATTFPEVTANRILGPVWRRTDGSADALLPSHVRVVVGSLSPAVVVRRGTP